MKRLRIILVVLAALLVGVVIICLVQPKEPSYQGRKLSEWLSDYGEAGWNWDSFHNIEATQQAAERAVKEIGTNAIPILLRWQQAKDSPLQDGLDAVFNTEYVVRVGFKTALQKHSMAMNGFKILGNDAMFAIPCLVRLMQSSNIDDSCGAMRCLFGITSDKRVFLPEFLPLLRSSDTNLQYEVASHLDFFNPIQAEMALGIFGSIPQTQAELRSLTNLVNLRTLVIWGSDEYINKMDTNILSRFRKLTHFVITPNLDLIKNEEVWKTPYVK